MDYIVCLCPIAPCPADPYSAAQSAGIFAGKKYLA